MTKPEFVAAVAEQSSLTKNDAAKAVDAMIDTISSTLKNGDKVSLIGFGTFETRQRAARTGRNPQTKEPMQIASATVPAFKPGKALKDAVGGK